MDEQQRGGPRAGAPLWNQIASEARDRPWPAPSRPWVLAQSWRHLLFAHWPVPAALLRTRIPGALALDLFAGEAWVGVVPFAIPYLAPRGAPRRCHLAFPELNVRTYVTRNGKPSVWFFSLDAASYLAVVGARAATHLPYYWAKMSLRWDDGWVQFASRRRHPGAPAARFASRYRPTGAVFAAAPGSLEAWLTARYCLYAADRRGRISRIEIHHPPWPLQVAEAEMATNTMAAAHGIALSGAPLLHFAAGTDVVAWPPERLDR